MKTLIALMALVFSATMALGASFPDYVPEGEPPSTIITPATGNFTWLKPKSHGSFVVSGEGTATSHRCNMIKFYGRDSFSLFILAMELKPILQNRPAYAFIDVIDDAFNNTSVKSGRVRVTLEMSGSHRKVSKMLSWHQPAPASHNEERRSRATARIKMHNSFFIAMAHFKILTLTFFERNEVLFEVDLRLDGGKEAVEAHISCINDYVTKYKNNPNDFPVR